MKIQSLQDRLSQERNNLAKLDELYEAEKAKVDAEKRRVKKLELELMGEQDKS